MDSHTKMVVAGLINYSFNEVKWDFDKLTNTEKLIVGNQAQLDILKKFVETEFKAMNNAAENF